MAVNEILKNVREELNQTIRWNTHRKYIDSFGCSGICFKVEKLLEKYEKDIQSDQCIQVLEVFTFILVSQVKIASYADSSSGRLTRTINKTYATIDECMSYIATQDDKMKKKAISIICRDSKKKYFDGWTDWRFQLLECATIVCNEKTAPTIEKQAEMFLEEIEDDSFRRYAQNDIAVIQYKICYQLDGKSAAQEILYDNLHISRLHQIAFDDAMNENNYEEAERLCLMKCRDIDPYINVQNDWDNMLYDIYEKAGWEEKRLAQALKLSMMGNKFYWRVLRETYSEQNCWEEKKKELLQKIKNTCKKETYRDFLVMEDEKELLLQYLRENPVDALYYGKHVFDEYKDEVIELCMISIRSFCKISDKRSDYKYVCQDIQRLIDWNALKEAEVLINEFKTTYPRRTAMIELLEKLEKKNKI